jgi:hypothetical protein
MILLRCDPKASALHSCNAPAAHRFWMTISSFPRERRMSIVLEKCRCSQLGQSRLAGLLHGLLTLPYVLGLEVRYSAGTMSRCTKGSFPASYLEAVGKSKTSSTE